MTTVTMVTEYGEEHGLVNTIANSVKDDGFAKMNEKIKLDCVKLRKEDAKMVKARYINHRGMHERLDKPYMLWMGEPIRIYHLIPGHVYDLPYGLVKEINSSVGLAQRGEKMVDGNFIAKDQKALKIHELVPISF